MLEAIDVRVSGRASAGRRRSRQSGHEICVVPHACRRRGRQTTSAWNTHFGGGRHRRRGGRTVFDEVAVALVHPNREDFVCRARDDVEIAVVVDVDHDRGNDVRARSNRREDLERVRVDRCELERRRPRRKAQPQPGHGACQEYDRRNEAERAMDPRQQHCVGMIARCRVALVPAAIAASSPRSPRRQVPGDQRRPSRARRVQAT